MRLVHDFKKTLPVANAKPEPCFSLIQKAERKRISADIHDELGSAIMAIRLMSENAKKKFIENVPPELDRISAIATDMLNNINVIIWSLQEEDDSLQQLSLYIKKWVVDFFEYSDINCVIKIEGKGNGFISGQTRRNVFLCIKEALTNVLKHANANEVFVVISTEPVFKIRISDNGRGMNCNGLRPFGNGIRNMKRRMEMIGGKCSVINNNGVNIILEI